MYVGYEIVKNVFKLRHLKPVDLCRAIQGKNI